MGSSARHDNIAQRTVCARKGRVVRVHSVPPNRRHPHEPLLERRRPRPDPTCRASSQAPNLVKLQHQREPPAAPRRRCWRPSRATGDDPASTRPQRRRAQGRVARHHGRAPGVDRSSATAPTRCFAHAFMALLKHDAPLWFPDITYSFYPCIAGCTTSSGRRRWPRTSRSAWKITCRAATSAPARSSSPTRTHPPDEAARARRGRAHRRRQPRGRGAGRRGHVDFRRRQRDRAGGSPPNLLVTRTFSKIPRAGGPARGLRGGRRGADRGAGAGQEQLQLPTRSTASRSPARWPRWRTGLVPRQLRPGDRDARGWSPTRGARLRGAALGGELHLRPPPDARRRRTPLPNCAGARSSCATSRRAHRPVHAHHRRHRRAVRDSGGGPCARSSPAEADQPPRATAGADERGGASNRRLARSTAIDDTTTTITVASALISGLRPWCRAREHQHRQLSCCLVGQHRGEHEVVHRQLWNASSQPADSRRDHRHTVITEEDLQRRTAEVERASPERAVHLAQARRHPALPRRRRTAWCAPPRSPPPRARLQHGERRMGEQQH